MNTFRTSLRAKGQYLMDYPTWCSLVMLMLVKYGNLDAQNTVGMGRNSGRAVIASGNTDSVLGLDGSVTDLTTNESVLTLGIENFYSNVFKFVDGLYAYNANIYIKDIEEIESDPIDAEELQSTYSVVTEKIPESGVNANMKNIAYDEEYDWMLFPTEYGTPNPFGDKYIVNKNFNSVVVGGSAWLGVADGLFFFMVLAVGSTGTGGGAMAIEFGELAGGDNVKETDISFSNLSEYDGLLRNDTNILRRNVAYTQNQIVNKGKVFLKCIVAGTTDTNTLNLTNIGVDDILTDGTVTWKVVSITGVPQNSGGSGGSELKDWQQNTPYAVDDLIVYNGTIYKVNTAFTSGSTFDDTNLDEYVAKEMLGASSISGGASGLVPAPTINDKDKFLKGDGTWAEVISGNSSGLNVGRTILWEGKAYTANQILTLSDDYTNYDYIIAYLCSSDSDPNIGYFAFGQRAIPTDKFGYLSMLIFQSSSQKYGADLKFSNNTAQLFYPSGLSSTDAWVGLIEGIKLYNSNTYSTTEQEIGTWIDGKKLYQKTFTSTSTVTTSDTDIYDTSLLNIDTMVEISGMSTSNDTCNYFYSNNEYLCIWYDNNDKHIYVKSSINKTLDAKITIKYTKTTD